MILARANDTLHLKKRCVMKIEHDHYHKVHKAAASLFRHLLLAWFIAATVEFLLLPAELKTMNGLKALGAMSFPRLLIITGIVLAILEGSSRFLPAGFERWMLAGLFAALAATALRATYTHQFMFLCLLFFVVLLVYAIRGWNASPMPKASSKESMLAIALTAAVTIWFFLKVTAWTVGRVNCFVTPTYDFGIFSQMFHSMKTTGLPITTVERDGALSHFAVHVSPIYYLLLPFYMIVPKPATLQVLQAAVLASAAIPLYLIGKRHGLHPFLRAALCALLFLYPAYAGGTSYDIHENAFLTPLIFWLFYSLDCKKLSLTILFAALTLMVKEDAAVYVAVIALWLLLKGILYKGKWELTTGSAMLVLSVTYFLVVTTYLANSGDGVMTYRYNNFIYDGSASLFSVVKAVLLSPMKAIFECADKEKVEFLALTVLPLAGIPLVTRRYERLVLLIPYILVNLMSDYKYQHDVFFQYTYGATACLFYLVAVNLADMKAWRLRILLVVLALCVSVIAFDEKIQPKATQYPEQSKTYASYYDKLREVLDTVPDGASVAATTFYTTYLSQRDVLYDVRYAAEDHVFGCEYMALGVTDQNSYKSYAVNGEKGYENFRDKILEEGYIKIAEYPGRLEIYQKKK